MKKLLVILGLAVALTGCGKSEHEIEMCALWTDLHYASPSGDTRVKMDEFCG